MPSSPVAMTPFMSPAIADLNGSWLFHSGCSGAIRLTSSSAKASWKYIGCSAQRVPSLSKVAIRSAGAMNDGEASFVAPATNVTIARLGAVSFHDGNGSVCATARAERVKKSAAAIRTIRSCFT